MTTALLALLEAFLRLGCSILTSSSAMRGGPYNPARAVCDGSRASGRGETGSHAGFRCRWRKPWGFESLRPHSPHLLSASPRPHARGEPAVDDDDRVAGQMDAVAVD